MTVHLTLDKSKGTVYFNISTSFYKAINSIEVCIDFKTHPEYITLKPAGIDDLNRIKLIHNRGSYRAHIKSKKLFIPIEELLGSYKIEQEEDQSFTLTKK